MINTIISFFSSVNPPNIQKKPSQWHKTLAFDAFSKAMNYLGPRDVARCESVCRLWKHMTNSAKQLVWKMQCQIQRVDLVSTPLRDSLNSYSSANVFYVQMWKQVIYSSTPAKFNAHILSLISQYENRNDYPLGFYKQQFSNPQPLTAIGKEQWGLFGNVGKVPALPPEIHQILKSPCPFFPGKIVEQTHVLALIPETLDGKSMTLSRLGYLMIRHGKMGYHPIGRSVLNAYDKPFETSHWILMTDRVLKGTEVAIFEEPKGFYPHEKILWRYPGYQVPKLAQAVVAIFMENVNNNVMRFGYSMHTFCQETRFFSHLSVCVNIRNEGLHVDDYHLARAGLVALRKL